ncbi:hypothetical protein V6N13_107014 [Hibiscus sabdariffa]
MDGIGLLNLARCVASNLVQEDVELGVIEVKEFRKIDENKDKLLVKSLSKFDMLCSVVENHDDMIVSPSKVRIVVGSMVELMNQLKPKARGPKKKKN